jgi:hypothetical protein
MRIALVSFAVAITLSSAPAQSCLGQLPTVQPAMVCSSAPVSLCLCGKNGTNCRWEWVCPTGPGASSSSTGASPSNTNSMIPLMGTPAPAANTPGSYTDGRMAAEQLRLMRQQTELLRQQTEALRKQNEAASALPKIPIEGLPPQPRQTVPQSDADSMLTNGMLNCSGWRITPADARLVYMVGILDGFQTGMTAGAMAVGIPNGLPVENFRAEMQKWMGKVPLTSAQRVDAMDAFCAPVENSAVQVALAVQVAAMKANGYASVEVEAMTAVLRRQ